jgi:hypothetical protein
MEHLSVRDVTGLGLGVGAEERDQKIASIEKMEFLAG